MGLLAEFFIADRQTASNLKDTGSLPEPEIVHYKQFTDLELGYLDQILRGGDVSYEEDSRIETVAVLDGGGRITSVFPPDLVDRLSLLDDLEIGAIASSWGKCEELSCPGADLEPVLTDLRRLAREAKRRDLGLYLWNCL